MARMNASQLSTVLVLFLVTTASALSKPNDAGGTTGSAAKPGMSLETRQRLSELETAIKTQQQRLDELGKQLRKTTDNDERAALVQQMKQTKEHKARLRESFEQIVIGGVDTAQLSDRPVEKIDWRAELEAISLPLLASLRDLTEKPRRIESLHNQIDQAERKLELIQTALASIETFQTTELPPPVKSQVAAIYDAWKTLQAETRQSLEVARLQYSNLSGQNISIWETLRDDAIEFLHGRGLTLALAAIAGILTWLSLRGVVYVYEKALLPNTGRVRTTRLRIVDYGFRTATWLLVAIAVFAVFYVRNDLLLMALSIAAFAGLALGLRQVIPRYVRETRLLLDIGPVREGERIILNGVPFRVVALNLYTVLKNPQLKGLIRLPLSALEGMTSRPDRDEPWFPTREGDYVLTSDGKLAQVVGQSVELVELKIMESRAVFPTADFISMGLRNISTTGFGIATTFGIDYEYQTIALIDPPETFRLAIQTAIKEAGHGAHISDITVDFKEAASSSLDYLIYLKVLGSGAPYYFKLARLVQQACVAVCNAREWTIPFNQLTLHAGDDLQASWLGQVESH